MPIIFDYAVKYNGKYYAPGEPIDEPAQKAAEAAAKADSDDQNDPYILDMIAKRAEAKKAKNFAEADRIRAELAAQGITLIDTSAGTKYKKD